MTRTAIAASPSLRCLCPSVHRRRERTHPGEPPTAETLPLPLPPAVWVAAVFGGRPPPQGLMSAILESRDAALLGYGLLSLDDDTRAWLAGRPDLIAEIASRHAPAFVLAAPALRVTAGMVRVPEALRGRLVGSAGTGACERPAGLHRALLADDKTFLTHFFGAMAPLTPGQVRFALGLDAPDEGDRVATAQRLLAAFGRAAPDWKFASARSGVRRSILRCSSRICR